MIPLTEESERDVLVACVELERNGLPIRPPLGSHSLAKGIGQALVCDGRLRNVGRDDELLRTRDRDRDRGQSTRCITHFSWPAGREPRGR